MGIEASNIIKSVELSRMRLIKELPNYNSRYLFGYPTLLLIVSLRAELAERGSLPQSVELPKIKEITAVAALPRNDILKLSGN
jgi:hypothetical protein